MADDPHQIPTTAEIVGPAIDAIVAARPRALAWINTGAGRWYHPIAGWRAQAALITKRLADECKSARLGEAEGQALRDLAASEYETSLPSDPQKALGSVRLVRPAGARPQGTFRLGDRFFKTADPTARPVPVQAAEYEAIAPVYVAQGTFGVTIPVRAIRAGAQGNVLQQTGASNTLIAPSSSTIAWDNTWATNSCFAAGGTSGTSDPQLRAAAAAYAQGQYGPTKGAIVAGALRSASVLRLAYFDYSAAAVGQLYIADPSWGSSPALASAVAQVLADNAIGFGLRVAVGWISNTYVQVTATVRLKRSQDVFDTTGVEANIRAAVRSYFDDRADWYTWRLASLRAVISRADPKILVCTSATVSDFFANTPIAEPAATGTFGVTGDLVHWYLADSALSLTFLPPT